jgi:hypothetical protein
VPDPGLRSPLIDFFRRGEVARDVRMLAAQGAMAPRAQEQLALLVLLLDDADPEVARSAAATIDALPVGPLKAFLSRTDVPREMKAFFAARGIEPEGGAALADAGSDDPLLDTLTEIPDVAESPEASAGEDEGDRKPLSSLPVIERMKLAMKGTREQRSQLVRDTNRLVAAAVLSSPKLTEAEVEAFTKMGNVSEETMRTIGMNRGWLKNYGILTGVCRHPKTPPAISMQLVHRLNDRDLKGLTTDRNVQEGLRQLARKIMSKGKL